MLEELGIRVLSDDASMILRFDGDLLAATASAVGAEEPALTPVRLLYHARYTRLGALPLLAIALAFSAPSSALRSRDR